MRPHCTRRVVKIHFCFDASCNVGAYNKGTRTKLKIIYFYSCYATPGSTKQKFQLILEELVADARSRTVVIINGDFNSWVLEWGSRAYNAKGHSVLQAVLWLQVNSR